MYIVGSDMAGSYTGYSVQGPDSSSDDIPVQNTTRSNSFGSCYLSCSFNAPDLGSLPDGGSAIQPCFYSVTIMEVIKGNYTVTVNVLH